MIFWAQYALQWYLVNSANTELKASVLPKLAMGELLGGTGQSNSMKSCCGIEETRLKATRVEGGWKINGTLSWVSNIGTDHYFHLGAKGYLLNNAAQRRLREAYFIAIVTPATKHLRKELAEMEQAPVCCAA